MEYTHDVQKWNGKCFSKSKSSSTSYYSMGAYMPGDDDIDEADVDTLGELYKLWRDSKKATRLAAKKSGGIIFTSTQSRRDSTRTGNRYSLITCARGKYTVVETRCFLSRWQSEEGYL